MVMEDLTLDNEYTKQYTDNILLNCTFEINIILIKNQ